MKILYILHLFFASVLSMGLHEIPEVSAVTNYCISRDTNVANPTESDEPDGRKPSTPTDNTENKKPSPFLCFFQKRTNSIRRRKISYSSQTSQSSVHSRSSTSSDPATLTEETSSQTAEDLSPQTITSVQNPGYGIDSAPSPTKCAIPDNDFGYEPPRRNRVLPDIPCTSDANGRSASQLPMENQTSAPAETFYANSSNPQENDVFRSIFCFDVKPSSFIRENSRLEASSAKKNDLSLYCENDENNYVEMNPPNTDPIMAGQQLLINEYRETIPLPTQQTLNKIFDMVTSWKPKCIFFFGKLYLVPKFTSWRYSQSQLLKEIEKVIQTLNLCAKVNTAQSPNNEKYKWGHIDKLLTKILKSIEELIAMNQKLESLFSHINEHYANHIQYLIKNVSGSQPKTCVNSENTINSSRINLHSLVKDLAGLIKHEQDHINVSGVFKSDAELNKFTEALVEETVEICQRSKEIMDCSKNSTICDLEAYRSILLQLYQPLTEVLPCCVDIVTHVRFIAQQFTCLNQQLMCLGIETKSSSLGN